MVALVKVKDLFAAMLLMQLVCCFALGWQVDSGAPLPASLSSVRVEDRVGQFVPKQLQFLDHEGKKVKLEDFLGRKKVLVLTLNYSDCPGLCIAQLENLVGTLKKDDVGLGDRYQILTISIDPRETVEKSARTKSKYEQMLANSGAQAGWQFLTCDQTTIDSLSKALGYFYTYDPINKRYNHPAATYFVSDDGRICRYLLDLGIEPEQFRLAIGETSQGKLGISLAEAFVQLCYYYDPNANRYAASAKRIMAIGGGLFCVLVFIGLAPFWFTKKRISAAPLAGQQSLSGDKPVAST